MTIDELKTFTEDYFNVSILPVDRKAHKVRARFLFYQTAYRMFPSESLTSLGAFLGQDHATVLHGIREVENIISSDKRFAELVDGYNKVLKKTDKAKTYVVEDYDSIKESRKLSLNISAKQKIKEQKKVIKEQNKIIVRKTSEIAQLKHRIKFYERMTGV